jgi:ribonuclease J
VAFAGPEAPGIDLVMPDLKFLESEVRNLQGVIITHAHEDHIGALTQLWPRLRAPVYLTQFAAGLLATRRMGEPGAPQIPLHIAVPGARYEFGPFEVEYIPVAHSIPESCALAIRSPAGLVVHTGDWKLDPAPTLGWSTDEAQFRALGDEGVLALICDSTNILREGESYGEAVVAKVLNEIILNAPARVAVTTFASNIARIKAVAHAALAAGREVVVVGRAMERAIDVARELGYLDGIPDFRGAEAYGYLPRNRVVALLTGSQGEQRAALWRIAEDDHPEIGLSPGDKVIFSSRTIPGNEKAVGRIQNALAAQNIDIITDRTHQVHTSGHPRRGEVKKMYAWTRPRIAIPAHGEGVHLAEHAVFAKAQGVPSVLIARNGDMVAIGADSATKIGEVEHGRIYLDGELQVNALERTIMERRRLSFAGVVSVAVAIDEKGDLAGDPEIATFGLPPKARDGATFDVVVSDAVEELFDALSRARRRDPEALRESLTKAVRGAVAEAWGKKPVVHVMVIAV